MSEFSTEPHATPAASIMESAIVVPPVGAWRRLSGDVRLPLVAMAILGLIMSVGFPVFRLVAPRETYILHLSDDAFYYLSVAPYIAAGQGPTADGITRTTGWHPLYGFILAGLYRLTSPSLDGFVKQAIALDSLLYLLSAWLLYRAAKTWWGNSAGVVAALLWLCNPFGVLIGQQGLESNLYACGLALLLWRFADLTSRPVTSGRYWRDCVALGLCAGLVVLSRTDAVLMMPLLALVVLMRARGMDAAEPSSRLGWGSAAFGVGLFGSMLVVAYAAWLGYVFRYTGEWNQGSAAIKMEWRKFQMSEKGMLGVLGVTLLMWGEYLLGTFLKVPAIKWALTGIPLLHKMARNAADRGLIHLLWLLPIVLGLAYSLLLDWTRAWYYMPGLLTMTLLAAGAAQALWREETSPLPLGRPGLAGLRLLVRNTAGLIAWAVVIESAALFIHGVHEEFDSDSEKLWALRAAAWLEKHAEPHARVGCWHSGILGYYTPHLDVINLDGLNNNDILQIVRGRKTLNQYWDERGITIIVGRPGEKMGRYENQWNNKQLLRWKDASGQAPDSGSLSIDEQIFEQKIFRVVEREEHPVAATQPGVER